MAGLELGRSLTGTRGPLGESRQLTQTLLPLRVVLLRLSCRRRIRFGTERRSALKSDLSRGRVIRLPHDHGRERGRTRTRSIQKHHPHGHRIARSSVQEEEGP